MTQQRHISSRFEIVNLAMRREESKFDKVITTATGAKLRPGAVFVLLRHGTDRPIRVKDLVLAASAES